MGKRKGLSVWAWEQLTKDKLVAIGAFPDLGPAIRDAISESLWKLRQGYDREPGDPGGEFFVDFLFGGTNFKYFDEFPISGTIKSLLVTIDGLDAYKIEGLNVKITRDLIESVVDGDTANFGFLAGSLPKLLDGNDKLWGSPFADTLFGFDGNDQFWSGGGLDIFKGGDGDDEFFMYAGVDYVRIKDFKPGEDELYFDGSYFNLGGSGHLPTGQFVKGTVAGDPDDRVIYDRSAGQVWADIDGTGPENPFLVAILENNAKLSANDVVLG